ncbi:MAG: redoxin domain-containing protein [Gammaproteobacteria bacterium]|nr:redoxin domain-containing protein [Gammaproteobacteria bacterium]
MFKNTKASTAADSYAGTITAPEFPSEVTWFNTAGKNLSLQALQGKVVLLDFWTYGCINCMHIIPDLKKLEEKFPNELVVVGVHSPKFEREKSDEGLANIVQRYERKHPIVNDRDFEIWRSYGARAWPTLVLIDPVGKIVGSLSGEGHYDTLDRAISALIAEFDANKQLDRTPSNWQSMQVIEDTFLRFPGRVLADTKNDRLLIADTNHHRIVVTTLAGDVLTTIGSGEAGLKDGDCQHAQFKQPQGLSLLNDNMLYVADTENHALRRVELGTDRCAVSTVIGDGKQHYLRAGVPSDGLNSPWDVLVKEGIIYIAMAGQHQVWVWDIDSQKLLPYLGSGREELRDGAPSRAGFNQPSGLTTDGRWLYIADAEASAIRQAPLYGEKGEVTTLVGTGLFDFGDRDGSGKNVLLQHALDVDVYQNQLIVTDTYNHKIKLLNPETRQVTSLNLPDDTFDEPGGLTVAGDILFVADTNHHQVKTITGLDIDNKQQALTAAPLNIEPKAAPAQ